MKTVVTCVCPEATQKESVGRRTKKSFSGFTLHEPHHVFSSFFHQDTLRSSWTCRWILSLQFSSLGCLGRNWPAQAHQPWWDQAVFMAPLQSPMQNSLSVMLRHENFHPMLFQFISGCCGDQFKWNSSILKENMSLSHLPCKVPC